MLGWKLCLIFHCTDKNIGAQPYDGSCVDSFNDGFDEDARYDLSYPVIVKELVEFSLVFRDLHPMGLFRVSPHPLQRNQFSTQFAGSLATVDHIIDELVLF